MDDNNKRTNVAYWKVERAGKRGVHVASRHGERSLKIGAFRTTLPTLLAAFLALLTAVRALVPYTRRRNATLKQHSTALQRSLVSWGNLLSRDLPDFESSAFTRGPDVPENVLGRAAALTEHVRLQEERYQQPLPYAEVMASELSALSQQVEEANLVAQDAMIELQERQRELNQSAAALHKELIALRRVVRTELGASHRDYQKLRMDRIRRDEVDEDDELPEGALGRSAETAANDTERGVA